MYHIFFIHSFIHEHLHCFCKWCCWEHGGAGVFSHECFLFLQVTDTWKNALLLILREMQIKTTMSCHLTAVGVALIRKTRNSECWWGERSKDVLSATKAWPAWNGEQYTAIIQTEAKKRQMVVLLSLKKNKWMLSIRFLPVLGRPCRPPTTRALEVWWVVLSLFTRRSEGWRKHVVTDCRGFTQSGDESTAEHRVSET